MPQMHHSTMTDHAHTQADRSNDQAHHDRNETHRHTTPQPHTQAQPRHDQTHPASTDVPSEESTQTAPQAHPSHAQVHHSASQRMPRHLPPVTTAPAQPDYGSQYDPSPAQSALPSDHWRQGRPRLHLHPILPQSRADGAASAAALAALHEATH